MGYEAFAPFQGRSSRFSSTKLAAVACSAFLFLFACVSAVGNYHSLSLVPSSGSLAARSRISAGQMPSIMTMPKYSPNFMRIVDPSTQRVARRCAEENAGSTATAAAPAAPEKSEKSEKSAKPATSEAPVYNGEYKTLLKVEMPEFIPRPDLMQQFLRWAYIELGDNAKENYGIESCEVVPLYLEDRWVEKYGEDPATTKVINGFKAQMEDAEIHVLMDDTVIEGFDYVGMDENGFPEKRGDTFEILGQYLEVRRYGDNPVSDATTKAVRLFAKALNSAFDKYYAFGSIYSDDAT